MFAPRITPVVVVTLASLLTAPGLHGTASALDHGTLLGTGTSSPGLPITGCAFQARSFSGTLVAVGSNAGTYNVTFNGASDICANVSTDAGSGTLSGGLTGSISYARTYATVTLSGSVTLWGTTESIVSGVCDETPTSFPPVTSYAWVCQIVLV